MIAAMQDDAAGVSGLIGERISARRKSGSAFLRTSFMLARVMMREANSARVAVPRHKSFNTVWAGFFRENREPKLDVYFTSPAPLEILNRVLPAPSGSVIPQPHLTDDNSWTKRHRKTWCLDEEVMMLEHVKLVPGMRTCS